MSIMNELDRHYPEARQHLAAPIDYDRHIAEARRERSRAFHALLRAGLSATARIWSGGKASQRSTATIAHDARIA